MDQRDRKATSTSSRNALRILMYGSPTSEPLLEVMHRCGDDTVLMTEDRRVFDSLARFAPDVVVCDVQRFMEMRAPDQPEMTRQQSSSPPPTERTRTRQRPSLTERESRVVDLVSKGFHNDEIGRLLDLHPRTVKNVLSQLYLKFDVTNRTELIGSLLASGEAP